MLLVVKFQDSNGEDFWFMQDTNVWQGKTIVEMTDAWLLGEPKGSKPTRKPKQRPMTGLEMKQVEKLLKEKGAEGFLNGKS